MVSSDIFDLELRIENKGGFEESIKRDSSRRNSKGWNNFRAEKKTG